MKKIVTIMTILCLLITLGCSSFGSKNNITGSSVNIEDKTHIKVTIIPPGGVNALEKLEDKND